MNEPNTAQIFAPFIPMLILAIPIVIFNFFLAERKGKNNILFAFLGMIPMVNFFCFLYLISLTDVVVLEKFEQILKNLKQ